MTPLARRLAAYAESVRFEALRPEVVREVKRRVLDSFGCAFGAWDSTVARIARAAAADAENTWGGTILGVECRALPRLAAFANGAMVRYLDFNDTYLSLEPAHPSDNIPACIAAAEAAGAGGGELIAAIALAYEIQCRLCDAAGIRPRGWDHVTYLAFSSALATGRLMRLDAGRLEQAVNLAGVNAAALRQTRAGQLGMWKGCAAAHAAAAGLAAARLASLGMEGPGEIFEGPMGFFRQVSGPFELDIEAWGPPSVILNTSIKFWPAEYHSQSAIDAALSLREEVGDPAAIRLVRISSFDAAVEIIGREPEKWRPTSRETADHSLPYCVAAALLDGRIGLEQFTEERIRRPDVRSLMDRIEVVPDEELTARYPEGIPNRLAVTGGDGAVHTREVTYPRGHARNPMTDDEVLAKYRALACVHLTGRRADALAGEIARLEREDPRDLMAAAVI